MDDPPRSQSVLQVRPQHRPGRANRLFSSFKGIIRLPKRKTATDDNHPYGASRHSDVGAKPYMSQPMLGLSPSPGNLYHSGNRDAEDSSDQSASPDHSPIRDEPQNPPTSWRSRDRSFSISNGLVPATQAGLMYGKRGASIDGLPAPRTHANPVYTAPPASKPVGPTTPKKKHQPTAHTPPDNTGNYNTGKPLPPDPTSPQVSKTITTSIPPDEQATPRPLHIQPRFISSASTTTSTNSSIPLALRPGSIATASSLPSAVRPSTITYGHTPIPSGSLAPNSTHHSVNNATVPQRRPPQAPRLTLPPANVRFSLSLMDGTARLSPSVIMRPPPLPLQLPTLPPLGASSSTTDAERPGHGTRVGLQSMPALPRRGTGRGVRAHEEADDGEEDEDEEEGEITDADGHEYHDDDLPRASVDSEASEDVFGQRAPSRSSSYHTAGDDSGEESHARALALPEVDTSRIDLSFLDRPAASPGKGKGKAREQDVFDPTRTPTSARPVINTRVVQEERDDYFNSWMPDTRTMKDRTPHPGATYASPTRTPKPGDAFLLPLPIRTPGLLGVSERPGMHKRASRSLVDVSAIGLKERVEKIVEEQEENLARRMSRRIKVVDEGVEMEVPPRIPGLVVTGVSDPGTGDVQQRQKRLSAAPAYDALPPTTIRRRRSMPTFNPTSDPPPYPSFAPFQFPKILPREDEGKERLPAYVNDLYLRAIMPRKVEFTSPGVQAKDRKWRRVMCVLEGTAFRVYRCPAAAAGVSAFGGWWERQVGVGDVAEDQGLAGAAARSQEAREEERRKEREKERELTRAAKPDEESDSPWDKGYGQVEVRLPSSQLRLPGSGSSRTSFDSQSRSPTPAPAATKSALNLAVNLLKPGKVHHRSNSDAPRLMPGKPHSPRASLNIPRPSNASSATTSSSVGDGLSSGRSVSTTSMASSTGSSYNRPTSPTSVPTTASSVHSHSGSNGARTPHSASSRYKDSGKEKEEVPEPHKEDLIKQYTLQNAESGLGNDYVKRKNVIRVRMEGEQFLLQAKDVASVVEWIEGLQAATNIALDLDDRPMPRGPLFPRRRRRRRNQASSTAGVTANVPVGSTPSLDPVAGRTSS